MVTLAHRTVLLVEDNEDNRIVYATILRHHGFRTVEAVDGEDAHGRSRYADRSARDLQPQLLRPHPVVDVAPQFAVLQRQQERQPTEAGGEAR